ncbi:hypothetical protein T281_09845 [Rhodomicrobium udaipurense JA643]|uniref:Uncharacterized protein n=1 Tax=Rhodomicrobium udaipurense TaxID=1202716 RepID=A0A8I1GGK8_9HYPH|nr:hypothetical protein [Rhodomicrobium udaipurense]KAI94651.1 hypothetical protein T281_09845 [Rhodomicrobium udaipurense JA643]MBJ7542975.1 hypothetical protein [Rhodomicrobium udaipurense]
MSQSLLRVSADVATEFDAYTRTAYVEERIALMVQKIGYVAACIDLFHWRHVIDQALREVEAERSASR